VSGEGATAIAPLLVHEICPAAAVIGRAFRDNPMNRAVVGGSPLRRERSNTAGMRAVLPRARERGTVLAAQRGGRLAGVLVALPPGTTSVGAPSWLGMLRLLAVQGPAVVARWSTVSDALQRQRPLAPHAYLATLGVEPALQHSGIGRALLGHWLAAIDALGQRAYLETDKAENVKWYEGFGFALRAGLTVLGVRVYLMERRNRDG
jgi:ribosomal protein S18 acetylase RimI-like enzyme